MSSIIKFNKEYHYWEDIVFWPSAAEFEYKGSGRILEELEAKVRRRREL